MGDRLRRCQQPAAPGAGLRPEVYDRNEDRWIIIDVVLRGTSWPEERWTWLDAGSNHGRAVWRHKMADDTWRLDFQLRPDEDAQAACHGPCASASGTCWANRSISISPGTASGPIATNACPACVMAACCSPVTRRTWWRRSARGGNGGIQDADNLGWKLALVLQGRASDTLLDSYSAERKHAAQENIRQARRSSRFVHPGPAESARMWRDAIIALAPRHDVPARMINTGRLCMPAIYPPSPLAHPASPHAGCALPNVVLDRRAQRSLHQLLGPWFTALVFGDPVPDIPEPAADDALLRRVTVGAHCDAEGRGAARWAWR